MESTPGKRMLIVLFFAVVVVRLRGEQIRSNPFVQAQNNVTSLKKAELPRGNAENVEEISNRTQNEVVLNNKRRKNNGGGGGGGGGGYWGWGGGCKKQPGKRRHHLAKKRGHQSEDHKMGEFAQCMVRGRCKGMRLDCPLHCGGPCLYDCRHMCKAHCKLSSSKKKY